MRRNEKKKKHKKNGSKHIANDIVSVDMFTELPIKLMADVI